MAVYLDFDQGDTLVIGDGTRVVFEHKSGRRTRVRIESEHDIRRIQAGDPVPASAGEPARPRESANSRGVTPPLAAQRRMPSQG